MTRKLYDHQRRALGKLPKEGGYLAFEQGLGKTLTAIQYVNESHFYNILVIAPAVALGVWEAELEEEGHWPILPTGTRIEKSEQIRDLMDDEWLVINYEALLEPKVEKAIREWGPDLIILDEAHKIKNATAKRSKAVHRLTKDTPALLLSGTPITKNLLDLYSQYKAIDHTLWNYESWTRFKARYAVWGGYGGYELIGYQNTDQLKALIAPWTIVARKEDTLDLPSKTFTVVPVTLTGNHWNTYRQMAVEGVTDEWLTTNPLEKALRLAQISSRSRISETVAFVQDLREQGEPVVVYARFRADLSILSEEIGVEALTGDTPQARRTEMVAEFQAGETDVFLAQIQAGSVGITLTAASHMVYHGLTFSYEDWAQSQDRIHRIGQDLPVNYYIMEARGPKGGITIDGLVLKALETKEDIAQIVTADPSLLLPKD